MKRHNPFGKPSRFSGSSDHRRTGVLTLRGRRLQLEALEQRMLLSVTVNDTFNGINQIDGLPPDPIVSAGPESLVAMVNTHIALYDKNGVQQQIADLDAPFGGNAGFFEAVDAEFGSFDPWTVYDRYSDRFFVMSEEVEWGVNNAGDPLRGGIGADEAYLLIGVSTSDAPDDLDVAPADLDNDWIVVSIDATHDFGNGLAWIDYPKLATDADSVYISGNFFRFGDPQPFQGNLIIRLDKNDLLSGIATVTVEITVPGATESTAILQPAQSVGRAPGEPQLFAGADANENGIDVYELDDANNLTLVANDLFFGWAVAGGAPQPGAPDLLDTLSDRLMNAVWRNGSLWTTHTVDEDGDATVRWYEIGTFPGGAFPIQTGDINPGSGIHTFMPAISVNAIGDMGITYTESSNTQAARMMVTGQKPGQPAGFTEPPEVIDTGAAGYAPDPAEQVERWGDYAGIAVDPIDDHTFWVFGETALNATTWTTDFGQFEVGPMFEDEFDWDGWTNNSLATATVLGSLPKITLRDLTIDDFDDVDYFQITAQDTGKLIINAYFQDALGDLDIRVFDELGNQIASSVSTTDNEQITIPVVTQERYFLRVEGYIDATNIYDLEIENFPAPIPDVVVLDPADDTGTYNSDDVTFDGLARIFIEADLAEFAAEGIDILTPTEVSNQEPGAAVEVFVNGGSVGYATPIAGTGDTLFQYTFTAGELSATFIPAGGGGGLNFVKAAVRMFDGQEDAAGNPDPADGRSQLSKPLLLIYDPTAPSPSSTPDLLSTSDSGSSDSDNVTNVNPPAFTGTAEPNTKIDIFANKGPGPVLVGEGVVGSDLTDGVPGNGLGRWEVTIEPLADGTYSITARLEDLAGNISNSSASLVGLVIDTIDGSGQPERPTIDLLDADDTGESAFDNITNLNLLRFRVTADPGTTVDVKDGNTVIDTFVMPGAGEAFRTYDFVALVGVTGFPAEGPHPLSAESTDLAGNRGPQSEELLVTIDTHAPKGMVLETFAADLTGAQEVPPVVTLAGGDAKFWLNPAGTRLEMTIELAGLDLDGLQTPNDATDNVTGLHIHRAAVGVNGPIVFGLIGPNSDLNGDLVIDAANNRISSAWDLLEGNATTLAAELANLRNGLLYVNVHTPSFPAGEIRGQILAAGGTVKLIQSSDTGESFIDSVTTKTSPAFVVKGEANAKLRILAKNVLTGIVSLVGEGRIGSDLTDGVEGNGYGIGEVTVEPMADGTYEIFTAFEDVAGNIGSHYDFPAQGLPFPIPDPGFVNVPINVQHLFGGIADIDVKFDITHPFVSDLVVQLISPAGTVVTLFSNIDGAGDNFIGTILDDEALTAINAGTPPYTGSFRLEAPALLSAFDGENPNGTWIFRVTDQFATDVGLVENVRLCILTDAGLPIEIDTLAPNTANLDLLAASDTGRHNADNVTRDNTPTVEMTTEDPNSAFHVLFTDNLKFRIYDRYESTEEFLLYNSAWDGPVDAVATVGDLFTQLQSVLETLPDQYFSLIGTNSAVLNAAGVGVLADGIHNLKLEVEDRAGNISHDFLLEVTIDTVAPPVTITGIDPAESDTGVEGQPATFADRITSDTATGFVGTAEADAIVRMWADGAPISAGVVNASDVFQGLTVAVPLDGNLAFPNGQWNLAGRFDLNDPTVLFPLDGRRQIATTAEDLAGNVSAPQFLDIFIDTRGPQVDGVTIDGDPGYDLFNPKGLDVPEARPTPLVFALDIAFIDQPTRVNGVLNFVYPAVNQILATQPGNYLLVGDANGVIPIQSIGFNDTTAAGGLGTTTVTLNFFEPLPDDRFTLTIFDRIKDDAGNALDGESNTIEPQDVPDLPSGDGDPGESFVARFTVDSRPEIGVWSAGSVYTDTNGNFIFDPANLDFTNRDITYLMGFASDDIFAGNFALLPGDAADGFDKLAAYGHNTASRYRWLVDTDNDGVANVNSVEPVGFAGLGTPVAGNFDGIPGNGDEVGLFTGTSWLLDTDHDYLVSDQVAIDPGLRGYPIVGDFDGDGADDLGVFLNGVFSFDLAFIGGLGNGIDATITLDFLNFIGVRERPVAADMNQDGIDDLGLWVPDRSGAIPAAGGEWYFLISDASVQANGSVAPLNHSFSPVPFGDDLFAQFGDDYAAPIVGNFDPPVAGDSGNTDPTTFSLEGTDGNDKFEVAVDGPGLWTVKLNGIGLNAGSEVITVEVDGLGGRDTLLVTGASGNENVKLWPGRGTLSGEGYSIAIAGAESITVRGGGGNDVAVLRGNRGAKDTFRARPEVAKLSGDGYANQVGLFRYVHAYGSEGDGDVAVLYDNAGTKETFVATPTYARLYSDDFNNRAVGFDQVQGYGTPGDADLAKLYDDPNGPDKFQAWPTQARLYGDGFYNRALSFRYVYAYATAGGGDIAKLYDDPNGPDKFQAWPTQARLFGSGFYNRASLFGYVHAYGTAGSGDVAELYGSSGNDTLKATSQYSRLSGTGFSNRAVSFDQVRVDGGDGTDAADLYDAVLEAGLTNQPVPAGIASIVWLYNIEEIRQHNDPADGGDSVTNAIDEIFTAYWE